MTEMEKLLVDCLREMCDSPSWSPCTKDDPCVPCTAAAELERLYGATNKGDVNDIQDSTQEGHSKPAKPASI